MGEAIFCWHLQGCSSLGDNSRPLYGGSSLGDNSRPHYFSGCFFQAIAAAPGFRWVYFRR